VYFGIRTAEASGSRFGSKGSREEMSDLSRLAANITTLVSETSLRISPDDMLAVPSHLAL
jgi:hypothetical protein